MNHYAAPVFWGHYRQLPFPVRQLANRCFDALKHDPRHPSLHLKQIGKYWSVRVGLHYRAVGVGVPDGISWFWIGTHPQYDLLVRRSLREDNAPTYA